MHMCIIPHSCSLHPIFALLLSRCFSTMALAVQSSPPLFVYRAACYIYLPISPPGCMVWRTVQC